MNEQIKALAKQAGMSVYTPDQDIQKFAELIVQECANHITLCYTKPIPYAKCHVSGLTIAAREIKEHFGVKE